MGIRHFFSACALVVFSVLPAHALDVLTLDQFRDRLLAELHEAYPDAVFEQTGPTEIRYDLTGPADGDEELTGYIFLDSQYQIHTQNPDVLDMQLKRFVQTFELSFDNGDQGDMRERLVALLRPIGYLDSLPSELGPQEFVTRPFYGDLMAVLMLDSPTAVAAVPRTSLDESGISEEEAWQIAEGNFLALAGEIGSEDFEGMTVYWTTNSLGAGLPLLTGTCEPDVGDFGLWLMDRETVVRAPVGTDGDMSGMYLLFNTIAGAMVSGEALSQFMITCFDGEWGALQPELDEAGAGRK